MKSKILFPWIVAMFSTTAQYRQCNTKNKTWLKNLTTFVNLFSYKNIDQTWILKFELKF